MSKMFWKNEYMLTFPIILFRIIYSECWEFDEEYLLTRSKRDSTPSNLRIPRFLDFYTCVSSTGTLGVCLPEPYCSYMIAGAILDPSPTKSCSHTMLSDYGCCTLPCSAANNVPVRSIPVPEQRPAVQPSPVVDAFVDAPHTTTTIQPSTTSTLPALFSQPIISSPDDFMTCGHINPNFKDVNRTVPRDTQLAPIGKWCWQAAIMDSSLTFKCGGTLLNNRHVLTVAHCVQKSSPSALLVRLGDTNLRSSDDNEDLVDVKVSDVTIHPDYTGQSPFQHNLAILTLSTDVPTNRNRICSVCLPTFSSSATTIESMFTRGNPNGRCVTTGYGKLESQDEFPLMRLKEIPVPLINNDQCSAILQGMLGSKFLLPDTFICAGGEGLSDGCEYDGGGPLVCPLNSNGVTAASGKDASYVLTGVVTWGIDCAKVGVPGVYTRISNYTQWIQNIISRI